jgi:hypothetical protein
VGDFGRAKSGRNGRLCIILYSHMVSSRSTISLFMDASKACFGSYGCCFCGQFYHFSVARWIRPADCSGLRHCVGIYFQLPDVSEQSLIEKDATATTYALACGDPDNCGIPSPFTFTQGPSTVAYSYVEDDTAATEYVLICPFPLLVGSLMNKS